MQLSSRDKNQFQYEFNLYLGDNDIHSWADILGFKIGTPPIMYLEARTGTNLRRKIFWKSLIKSSAVNLQSEKVVHLIKQEEGSLLRLH